MSVLALSLGSNIDPRVNIYHAQLELRELFGAIQCSRVYESEAVGFQGDNFLNMVVAVETDIDLKDIIRFIKSLENALGRNRSQPRFASRTIDIDVLFYGSATGEEVGIQLPRAEIVDNAFVLQPLADLLPDTVHTKTGRTYRQLWEQYDKSQQRLWPIDFESP